MIHLLFWVSILVLGLSYFGISLQAIISSPAGQENIAYLFQLLSQAWHFLFPYIQPVVDNIRTILEQTEV